MLYRSVRVMFREEGSLVFNNKAVVYVTDISGGALF